MISNIPMPFDTADDAAHKAAMVHATSAVAMLGATTKGAVEKLHTQLPSKLLAYGESVLMDAAGRLQQHDTLPGAVLSEDLGPELKIERPKDITDRIFKNIPPHAPLTKDLQQTLHLRIAQEFVRHGTQTLTQAQPFIENSIRTYQQEKTAPVFGLNDLQNAKYVLLDERPNFLFPAQERHVENTLHQHGINTIGILHPTGMMSPFGETLKAKGFHVFHLTMEDLQKSPKHTALHASITSGQTAVLALKDQPKQRVLHDMKAAKARQESR